MYDEGEVRPDPDKWMSPGAVADLWGEVGYKELSLVTVRGMMEHGWFLERGVTTEEFDPGSFRVLRDELLSYMMRDVTGMLGRLTKECVARGIDCAPK